MPNHVTVQRPMTTRITDWKRGWVEQRWLRDWRNDDVRCCINPFGTSTASFRPTFGRSRRHYARRTQWPAAYIRASHPHRLNANPPPPQKKKKTKKKKNSRNLKRFFSTSSLVTLTAVAVLERGGLNATLRRVGRTVDLERFPRGCQIEKETWTDVTSGSTKIAPNASTN